jgi:hypothetical protein
MRHRTDRHRRIGFDLAKLTSSTHSDLIASRQGGEALLIDPALKHTGRYIQLARDIKESSYRHTEKRKAHIMQSASTDRD